MNLVAQIEAILFAAAEPVRLDELSECLQIEGAQVLEALNALTAQCTEGRGVQLLQIAGGYQFATKPEFAEKVGRYLKPGRNKLTKSQLEVLAVVAYQQPCTVAEIDAVRGVQSDHSLRLLLDRRLVQEVGRKPTPGRPVLYGTSDQFLHLFNLNDVSQLPAVQLPSLAAPEPVELQSSES